MPAWDELTPWQRVDKIARRQHQAVTRRQVASCGICARTLTERVRDQAWSRPHRGVFVLPGAPGTYELDCSAALLAVGEPAAVTGIGALYLRGFVTKRPDVVPIAVPGSRSLAKRKGVVFVRTTHFDRMQTLKVAKLRVAAADWAFTDLPRHASYRELGKALVNALRRRLATLDAVERVLGVRGTIRGAGTLREAIADLRGELSHSQDEAAARRHLAAAGVVVHPRPYPVERYDKPFAEIDLAVPEVLYGAEVDGLHHLLPEQNGADKARDRQLGRMGWTIDRFTLEDIRDAPEAFVRDVLARLEQLGVR